LAPQQEDAAGCCTDHDSRGGGSVKYLSVCSGIEAATVAWHPIGWQAFAYSEIEAFPSAVLAHHYPDTPNLGDMTKFKEWPHAAIDLLVGGTPCQSFSVAGLRKGLADPRGNLMLTYLAIADQYRPQWLVWENVPGVLSSNKGRDFGTFLAGLGQLGYGFAYRVLDAQYFGVAQRRRRVFVVGYLGDWRAAAAVLFERHSLSGHPAPSREKGKVAPTIPSRSSGGGGLGTDFDCDGGLIHCHDVAPTLNAAFGSKLGLEDQHIRGGGGLFVASHIPMLNNQVRDAVRPGNGDSDSYYRGRLRCCSQFASRGI
jgi:site-specific DNA-cytosine methylase